MSEAPPEEFEDAFTGNELDDRLEPETEILDDPPPVSGAAESRGLMMVLVGVVGAGLLMSGVLLTVYAARQSTDNAAARHRSHRHRIPEVQESTVFFKDFMVAVNRGETSAFVTFDIRIPSCSPAQKTELERRNGCLRGCIYRYVQQCLADGQKVENLPRLADGILQEINERMTGGPLRRLLVTAVQQI